MARSLNRVQLIGNLTRDPELRYTPNGTAVCSFGVATNRSWTTESGEKREEAEFHRIVAWNKLAEICSQFLVKGRKVYLEGRLSTRTWNAQDGTQKSTTEIIVSDMILLDSRRTEEEKIDEEPESQSLEKPDKTASLDVKRAGQAGSQSLKTEKNLKKKKTKEDSKEEDEGKDEDIAPEDIPF